MKKIILPLLLGLSAGVAGADSKIALTVNGTNGVQAVYNISDIQNITFEGNTMFVNQAEDTYEHDLDAIDDMVFTTISGIDAVLDEDLGDGLQISVRQGVLTATLPDGKLSLKVFTIGGNLVDDLAADSELVYQLSDLDSGVYIILVNDKAIKFIR